MRASVSHAPPSAPDVGFPQHTLPLQLTRLVGREREVTTLARLLEETRLLTLTGAGGSGKTRLALEVAAREVRKGTRGVLWVELAPLQDPELIPQQIAGALGVREEGGRPLAQTVLEALRERRLLLVLDNCEHLVEACSLLADALLRGCPALQILATSREALGVGGEKAWLVPPLSLPEEGARPETLLGAEAVELFVDRARDAVPSFNASPENAGEIAAICRRLDGLPLAIELAAARVAVLSTADILERLDSAFTLLNRGQRTAVPRHRTLRATIEWSYALLTEHERWMLQRFSVFTGGFTLDAAEEVCSGEQIPRDEVLPLLATLVERSLVVMQERGGSARYRLLETIRQYAAERLQESGEAPESLRRRHAEFFLRSAREAAPHLVRASPVWMERLEADLDNYRAALTWSHASGNDGEIGLPMGAALTWFWYHRLLWGEGRARAELLLAAGTGSRAARAAALQAAGIFAFFLGDLPAAEEHTSQSVTLWRELNAPGHLAFALGGAVQVGIAQGDLDGALALAEEAVALARTSGDAWEIAFAQGNSLATVLCWRGKWQEADRVLLEAEGVFRAAGYSFGLAYVLHLRTLVALRLGAFARTFSLGAAALRELEARRDHWLAARVFFHLASAHTASGAAAQALRLLSAADALLRAIGARLLPHEVEGARQILDALKASLPAPDAEQALRDGARLGFDEAITLALEGCGAHAVSDPFGAPVPRGPGLISSPPAQPETQPVSTGSPAAAPVFRVRALGPLRISREKGTSRAEEWAQSRPRELLLHLLVHPEGRTRDQIGLVFWPDASAAQVKNSFHVLLHKLRRALGDRDLVILEGERYRLDPAASIRFDVADFERAMAPLLSAYGRGEDVTDLLEDPLALYAGDFLEGEVVGDWHIEVQDRLRRLYVQGLRALAEGLMGRNAYPEAAAVLERLVRREDLDEEAHRALMISLARAGERTRALKQYDRLVTLLRLELEAEPEPLTEKLAERIRRGEAV
jgi:predicted ATPase/DNA-binding SARP family transcriptional activator